MTEQPICCSVHPEEVAGWQCNNDACRKHLCGKCTAQLIKLYTCCTCGGPARQLTESRKSKSRAYWLGATLRYPFGAGLPVTLLMAIVLGAVGFIASLVEAEPHQLDTVVIIVRACLLAGYVLATIDRAARGAESGKLLRFAHTLVATMFIWVPTVSYIVLLGVPGRAAQHDWALWMFGILALVYLPLVLGVAVTDTAFATIANPFRMFDCMFRLGKIYVVTLVATIVLAGLSVFAAAAAPAIQHGIPTPILRDALAQLPLLAGLAMLGHVIGMIAHVHGDLVGWGSAALFVDPLFPDMVAEGRRKIVARQGAEPSADGTTQSSPIAPVSQRERTAAAKLAAALKAEQLASALRVYETLPSWSAASIDERQLVMLAKAAVRAKKIPLAQRLLEEACGRNGRTVGQAWLALAQLHADSLGEADKARDIYRKIVDQFPGSDVAKLAASQMSNVRPGVTA